MNKVMYNELQKRKYIENCKYEETTRETIIMMFRGAARVEKRFGTDLSNFNKPQVEELLKSYNSKSRRYLINMCVYYADYVNWCRENLLIDPSNAVNQYDSSMVNHMIKDIVPVKLIKGKFFNKEDVLEYLDCIEDISNKFIMYALFKGLTMHELSYLKMLSLNEENKVIKLMNGRLHPVDDLFIDLMKKTDKAEYYYAKDKLYTNNRRDKYDDSIYILKFCRNNRNSNIPVNRGYFALRLTTIKKQTGNKFINAPTLYNNGLISFIKEHYEKKGVTLYEVFNSRINKRIYTYEDETQNLIEQFGSKKTVRMLRYELKDTLHYYL